MKSFQILNRRQKSGLAVLSTVASASVLAAALSTFVDDASTPWFKADSHAAALLVRCAAMDADSQRHACIRQVAAVASAPAGAALAVAHAAR